MKEYLIRLDDACPTMDKLKWQQIEDILDKFGIKPMVGIIPSNADPQQCIDTEDGDFWEKALRWQAKGWSIAMHGYDHCYISDKGRSGLNPLWERSEFSGVDYDIQCKKIREGYDILKSNGLNPQYFFAPSHTFDENTLKALRECSDIRIISDTIALKPYRNGDFTFIPQIGGGDKLPLNGVWTFCLHPSAMKFEDIYKFEEFIKKHKGNFSDFKSLNLSKIGYRTITDKILSLAYFGYRNLRRIR